MIQPKIFVLAGALALAILVPARAHAGEGAVEVSVEYERYELANGLEVILHRDPAVPEIAVNLWYHVGSGDEMPGKTGFAHLFEHMMFQGAKHIGKDVHFDILKEIGASGINGTTNSDRTNYFETVPRHEIETALWLESDRMGYLLDLLDEASFRNQVDVVRNERRQNYDNRPYGAVGFEVAAALYPEGHPYRYLTIGRHEDLENADLEDVRAFFRTWYVPSNATLVLAGDFETDDAKALIEKWFGAFPRLPEPERRVVATPVLAHTFRKEVHDPLARLEQVTYVWHAPAELAEGSYELEVAAEVLGASGWGRLYKRLVIEEKLCTYAGAGFHGQQRSGAFNVVAQLAIGADRGRVEAVIQEEIERLRREPISDAELRRVLLGAEAGLVWGLESLSGRADRLQFFNHFTGDPGYAPKFLARLRTVTPAAVLATTARYLGAARVEILVVPKGTRPGRKSDAPPGEAAESAGKAGQPS